MSPENNPYSDKTDKRDDVVNDLVKDYLSSKGCIGYEFGKPTYFDGVCIVVCVLDPEKDTPEEILVFAKEEQNLVDSISPLKKGDYEYECNDPEKAEYSLRFKTRKEGKDHDNGYFSTFNRHGEILTIQPD